MSENPDDDTDDEHRTGEQSRIDDGSTDADDADPEETSDRDGDGDGDGDAIDAADAIEDDVSSPGANGDGDGAPFVTEAEGSPGVDPDPAPAAGEATQEDVEHAIEDVDVAAPPGGEESGPEDDVFEEVDGDAEDLPFDTEGDAPEPDEAFEEVEVGTVDEQEVWSRIEDEDLDAASDGTADSEERRETVVPKNTYCERCEHFAKPPRMECTHEGTEILELVDREHVRVVDCPVVEERDALGEREADPAATGADESSDVFIE